VVFHKTAKFKQLQAKWYKKLEKSGFEDAEQDELYLKQYSAPVSSSIEVEHPGILDDLRDDLLSDAKQEYYRWCRHMLNDWQFRSKTEHRMFEMHSEVIGIRVIAKKLRTYKNKVHKELTALIQRMKSGNNSKD